MLFQEGLLTGNSGNVEKHSIGLTVNMLTFGALRPDAIANLAARPSQLQVWEPSIEGTRVYVARAASKEFGWCELKLCFKMRVHKKGLTRIRRKNPAFNYGFFRPSPLALEHEAGKNAGHAVSLPVQATRNKPKLLYQLRTIF